MFGSETSELRNLKMQSAKHNNHRHHHQTAPPNSTSHPCLFSRASLFVAGATLGDSRGAKCCIFPYKAPRRDRTRKLRERAGARDDEFMVDSCSDHGRIAFALAEAIDRFFSHYIFVAGAIVGDVGGRILWLEVSCVTRTSHLFICRGMRNIWWCSTFGRHFSWQAQYVVKLWEIAGARIVVFFHTKRVAEMGQGSSANGHVIARCSAEFREHCTAHGSLMHLPSRRCGRSLASSAWPMWRCSESSHSCMWNPGKVLRHFYRPIVLCI